MSEQENEENMYKGSGQPRMKPEQIDVNDESLSETADRDSPSRKSKTPGTPSKTPPSRKGLAVNNELDNEHTRSNDSLPATPARKAGTPGKESSGSRGNSRIGRSSSGAGTPGKESSESRGNSRGAPSSAGTGFNINLSIAEKKKLRQQVEDERKEAKIRQKQVEADKVAAALVVKEKEMAFEDLQRAVAINTTSLESRWGEVIRCHRILMGYLSTSGDRDLEEAKHYETGQEDETPADFDEPDGVLNGVVGGEFQMVDEAAFPVRTEITGYPEARSKKIIRLGDKGSFKIGIHRKKPGTSWSIGIISTVGGLPLASAWGGNQEAEGKVVYMNTARATLYNGPHIIYSVSAASQDKSETEAFYGKNGWEGMQDFQYNWAGEYFHCQQGDQIEVYVNLEDEGLVTFARNGRLMPHSIHGVTGLLQLKPCPGEDEDQVESKPATAEATVQGKTETEGVQEDARLKVSFAEEGSLDEAAEGDLEEAGAQDREDSRIGVCLAVQMSQVGDIVRLYHGGQQDFLAAPPPAPPPEEPTEETEAEAEGGGKQRRRSRTGSVIRNRRGSTSDPAALTKKLSERRRKSSVSGPDAAQLPPIARSSSSKTSPTSPKAGTRKHFGAPEVKRTSSVMSTQARGSQKALRP